MRIFLIIFLFLFVSALVVVSNNSLHLNNSKQAEQFASLYYSWLIDTGSNIIKTTGYLIKFEWLPTQNATVISNSSG